MYRTTLMQHFPLVTLFDLTLTLNFTLYMVHTYMLPLSSLGSSYANVGFAAIISLVSVAQKAKSDAFDL